MDIFLDDQDYRVFLHLLKYYLSPTDDEYPLKKFGIEQKRKRPLKSMFGEIELYCYCLMPNHFHLLVKQISKMGMQELMKKLTTTYAMYFNKRYKRVGYLFQGRYKASIILQDNYLLYISKYIHTNPSGLLTGPDPISRVEYYPYSSYKYYLQNKNLTWLLIGPIMHYFTTGKSNIFTSTHSTYREFVEDIKVDPIEVLGELVIE